MLKNISVKTNFPHERLIKVILSYLKCETPSFKLQALNCSKKVFHTTPPPPQKTEQKNNEFNLIQEYPQYIFTPQHFFNICSYFKHRGLTCKTCQELVQHDALAKQSSSAWNSWAATKCVTGRQRDKRDTRWWQRGQHNMLTTFAHHDKHETSTLRITSYSLLQFPQIPSRGLTRWGGWDEGGFCSKANKYLMKQGWENWSPMY